MNPTVASSDEVRAALAPLALKQLEALAELSGVPFTTIYKIKRGETANPGIETVRQFLHLVPAVVAAEGAPPPLPSPAAAESAEPHPAG